MVAVASHIFKYAFIVTLSLFLWLFDIRLNWLFLKDQRGLPQSAPVFRVIGQQLTFLTPLYKT